MCTVTALPAALLTSESNSNPLLLRVVCNRDEQLSRAPALPPTLWTADTRRVLMPIDPSSGGTWIAANDAGLVFTLLNTYDEPGVHAGDVSRGTIIPALIASATISDALSMALRLPVSRFAPFRLLIFGHGGAVDCWPHGGRLRHRYQSPRSASLRTSSSLGDHTVIEPRRALFQRMLREDTDAQRAQDRFHRHRWPRREAISVDMQRAGARTVSRTIVEVRVHSVTLAYQATEWPHPVAVRVAA